MIDIKSHRIQELERKCSFSLGKDDLSDEEIKQWKILDRLRKISDDELAIILEDLNQNNSRQRSFTNLILSDFGLNAEKDFKKEKEGLVLQDDVVAPILIKKRDNRVIFK